MLYEELSKKIVHAAHLVHDELKFGFLEAVYGNALYKELSNMGLKCECQKQLDVFYKGDKVGHYVADMVVINFGRSVKVKRKILTKDGQTEE